MKPTQKPRWRLGLYDPLKPRGRVTPTGRLYCDSHYDRRIMRRVIAKFNHDAGNDPELFMVLAIFPLEKLANVMARTSR